ncbi:MAG TPA: ATP-binding protein [Rhodanobacteraceae bacterium]|nr:ATP-binding protein [Rhodanobacteraceae bacterium]
MSRAWRVGSWLLLVAALYAVAVVLALDVVAPSPRLGRWYVWLAVAAALALAWLLAVIVRQWLRLRQRVRRGEPGARLTRRLVGRFALIALPPALVVYAFSLNFLVLTVDAWFNVRLEHALDNALSLDRLYVGNRLAAAEQQVGAVLPQLAGAPDARLQQALEDALDRIDALQLSVLTAQGRSEAVASADPQWITPPPLDTTMLTQLRGTGRYAAAEPLHDQLVLRVVLPMQSGPGSQQRVLQALYALPPRMAALSQQIEGARFDFERLKFLRGALKLSFVLILSFVVLLSLLAALLAAVAVARRLLAPIGQLAAATRTLGEGRYDIALPSGRDDELGFLLDSFAGMTTRLQQASSEAEASRAEIERQRTYLETVLERLSSGVLGFDAQGCLRSANRAASDILELPLTAQLGATLQQLQAAAPALAPLLERIAQHRGDRGRQWREEVRLRNADGTALSLMLRGTALGDGGGMVVVFDDQTALDRAQRDAAWAEVARRLAHEVKNPLTPIRLAAERVHHRLRGKLGEADAEMLARATGTIVSQVDALKALVNAFGDYARNPPLVLERQPLDALVREVLDLYDGDPRMRIEADLRAGEAQVMADAGKLRQLLHNLIKNALEALDGERLRLRVTTAADAAEVSLSVADNGPGLPAGFDAGWFEPYVTGKPQGSGLGLAVVKKIAEEHGGQVHAANGARGGAEFVLVLPRAPEPEPA